MAQPYLIDGERAWTVADSASPQPYQAIVNSVTKALALA
jgi:hypothetical protein